MKLTIIFSVIFGAVGLVALLTAGASLLWICVQRRKKRGDEEVASVEEEDVKGDEGGE
jgi:hypothetical protein